MRIAATTAFAVLAATTAFAQNEAARKIEFEARMPLEQAL